MSTTVHPTISKRVHIYMAVVKYRHILHNQLWSSSSKNGSVRLPVYLSVSLSFSLSLKPAWQCSCHRITIDRIDIHAKGQDQRSQVQFTEVKTKFPQIGHLRMVIPVLIHRWLGNDALSWCRRVALLFLWSCVIFQEMTWDKNNRWFSPKLGVSRL